ncbi:hypothetical protein D3C76_1373850 [compost metagenome]|nr:hypothetical protein F6476_05080 [Pseudomonas umsongensis]
MSNRRTFAMDVNDDAGCLIPRGVLKSIVGTPPGACSLLQVSRRTAVFAKGAKIQGLWQTSRP